MRLTVCLHDEIVPVFLHRLIHFSLTLTLEESKGRGINSEDDNSALEQQRTCSSLGLQFN